MACAQITGATFAACQPIAAASFGSNCLAITGASISIVSSGPCLAVTGVSIS